MVMKGFYPRMNPLYLFKAVLTYHEAGWAVCTRNTWIKVIILLLFNKVGKSAVYKFDRVYIPQQFGYKINSSTLLIDTCSCTQCAELLIAFCNGNSTPNSSVGKQYDIQKPTTQIVS